MMWDKGFHAEKKEGEGFTQSRRRGGLHAETQRAAEAQRREEIIRIMCRDDINDIIS
jgi:hypothetical protein